jgi:hypothetical protein
LRSVRSQLIDVEDRITGLQDSCTEELVITASVGGELAKVSKRMDSFQDVTYMETDRYGTGLRNAQQS